MTNDYLTLEECNRWREHYDERIEAAMTSIAESEESSAESHRSLRRTAKWSLTLLVSALGIYVAATVTTSIHAEDKQYAKDALQDRQMAEIRESRAEFHKSMADVAASQARTSAMIEGHVKQSEERKQYTDSRIDDLAEEAKNHRRNRHN